MQKPVVLVFEKQPNKFVAILYHFIKSVYKLQSRRQITYLQQAYFITIGCLNSQLILMNNYYRDKNNNSQIKPLPEYLAIVRSY